MLAEAAALARTCHRQGRLPLAVAGEVAAHKDNHEGMAAALLKHCAANPDNHGPVRVCAPILRALGYTLLADRMESRIAVLSLRTLGEMLEVKLTHPPTQKFLRAIGQIPGVVKSDGGWTVPVAQRLYLMAVLGSCFHGEQMALDEGLAEIPYASVGRVEQYRRTACIKAGTAPLLKRPIHLEEVDEDKLRVEFPFDAEAVQEIKNRIPEVDRTWVPAGRVNGVFRPGYWILPACHAEFVREVVQRRFGFQGAA